MKDNCKFFNGIQNETCEKGVNYRKGAKYKDTYSFHATEAGCKLLGFTAAQIKKALSD